VELIPFETMTVTTQQFLTGGKDGKPATIAGELHIPKSGSEKVGAVILMEGAGGIGPNIEQWVYRHRRHCMTGCVADETPVQKASA
jgi:hypothetical protein